MTLPVANYTRTELATGSACEPMEENQPPLDHAGSLLRVFQKRSEIPAITRDVYLVDLSCPISCGSSFLLVVLSPLTKSRTLAIPGLPHSPKCQSSD